jgi:organic radical activating enzyme
MLKMNNDKTIDNIQISVKKVVRGYNDLSDSEKLQFDEFNSAIRKVLAKYNTTEMTISQLQTFIMQEYVAAHYEQKL